MTKRCTVTAMMHALLAGSAVGQAVAVIHADVLPTAAQLSANAATGVFHAFELYPPVLTVDQFGQLIATNAGPNATSKLVSSSVKSCQQTLVEHSFAYSYGTPYVVPYEPPSCSFNQVTWNLTILTSGVQYDRQGTVSFGDVELFRTTTIEPDKGVTEYTYLKDMSPFMSLFKSNNSLIFDLPNVIQGDINGDYNVTLTASYFTRESSYKPADEIFTISQNLGSQGQPGYFTFPQQNASEAITLPRNIQRAVYTVVAVAQADEEFYWSAGPNADLDVLPLTGFTDNFTSFREVQLFIDGQLAGVSWPFPILFSGADNPQFWRPIGGLDILDLKEYEIDITPWLPLLCDGNPHTFNMRVSGLNDAGENGAATLSETVLDDWYLGGKVFVWLDEEGHVTTGDGPHQTGSTNFHLSTTVGQNKKGQNSTMVYNVEAQRNLAFSSTLQLSTGKQDVFWSQDLNFTGIGNFTKQGFYRVYQQDTVGYEVSSSGYARQFSYPFLQTQMGDSQLFLRGKNVEILGQAVFPTGLETFFSNQTGRGSSSAVTQNVTASRETILASADLMLAAVSLAAAPQPGNPPSIQSTEKLFEQQASASQAVLVSDVNTFFADPEVKA